MFESPRFDPRTMTDDELVSRANDLTGKFGWASRSADAGLLNRLVQMVEALNEERRERSFMEGHRRGRHDSPVMLETDPDLRDAARREAEQAGGKQPKEGAPRPRISVRRPVPTATPTLVEVQPGDPTTSPVQGGKT